MYQLLSQIILLHSLGMHADHCFRWKCGEQVIFSNLLVQVSSTFINMERGKKLRPLYDFSFKRVKLFFERKNKQNLVAFQTVSQIYFQLADCRFFLIKGDFFQIVTMKKYDSDEQKNSKSFCSSCEKKAQRRTNPKMCTKV